MTPQPEIRELPAQPVAAERAVTDADGLPGTIDRTFPALFEQIAARGTAPAGPPYVRYFETGERFDIELGVPLPAGDGEDASLPSGRAAVLRYTGPYDGLPAACEQLGQWVEDRGEEAAGAFWESYVTDPRSEPDPSKRITEIYLPLRG
jgi:effector-binding domain-containing protein